MVCFDVDCFLGSRSGDATEGESGSVGGGSGVGESKGKHVGWVVVEAVCFEVRVIDVIDVDD